MLDASYTLSYLFIVLSLSISLLTSCGDGGEAAPGSDLSAADVPGSDIPGTDVPSTDSADNQTIGPEGGEVAFGDGGLLVIPPGALTQPVAVSIAAATPPEAAPFTPAGDFWRFEPAGLDFLLPATLRVPFLGTPEGLLLAWGGGDGDWTWIEADGVGGDHMVASIRHFSLGGPARWGPDPVACCVGGDCVVAPPVACGGLIFEGAGACEPSPCGDVVCCTTEGGAAFRPQGACDLLGGLAGDAAGCLRVCCEGDDGTFQLATAAACAQDGGQDTGDLLQCERICCTLGAEALFTTRGSCGIAGGTEVATDQCPVPPLECTSDADCADGNPCTEDDCMASVCTWKDLDGAPCDDGFECSVGDACLAGVCIGGALGPGCEPACCKATDGQLYIAFAKDCPNPLDLTDCTGSVCCDKGAGPVMALATECVPPGGAVLDYVQCGGEVCCVEVGSAALMSAADCVAGIPMIPGACESVCCLSQSAYLTVPKVMCEGGGGSIQDAGKCEPVCCKRAEDGQKYVTSAGLCDAPLDLAECTADVCCDKGAGASLTPAADCLPPGGTVVNISFCGGEVCCVQVGSATLTPAVDCVLGMPMVPAACDMVCCESQGVYVGIPAAMCEAGLGTVQDASNCEPVCCVHEEDGQRIITAAKNCPEPVDMIQCTGEVCCDQGNGPVKVPAQDCVLPAGTVLNIAQCGGQVCCATLGSASLKPAADCADGIPMIPELCTETCCVVGDAYTTTPLVVCLEGGGSVADDATECQFVCCTAMGINMVVPKGNCPEGATSPESECASVCCTTGGTPILTIGATCPDEDEVALEQCAGQCLTESDCGPAACSADGTQAIPWTCQGGSCVAGDPYTCPGGTVCAGGGCAALLGTLEVPGNCGWANASWDAQGYHAKIRLTVTFNKISCCANSGCGFYNASVGPTPCYTPVEVNAGLGYVNVDVSQWEGNVGDSYVLTCDDGQTSVSGHYTDGYCSDNVPDAQWIESAYPATIFSVTAAD